MKKVLLGGVLGALLVCALGYAAWWCLEESGWFAYSKTAPHPKNLAAAIDKYLSARASYPQCLPLGYMPFSPQSGRATFPDTQFDFSPTGYRILLGGNAGGESMLARFQFMARSGLLNSKPQADGSTEFTMTWKGYPVSNEQGCFFLSKGNPKTSVISSLRKSRDGSTFYEVAARVSPGDLPEWTRDKEFPQIFGDAARMLEAKVTVFELVRDEHGFAVFSENGAPVQAAHQLNPALLAINARRAGQLDAEKINALLKAHLEGNGALQARACLPIPASDEVDETDFHTQTVGSGGTIPKTSAFFLFYNVIDAGQARQPILRGYETMRRLETLGLAKSELVPANDFKGAAAAGAVRFEVDGEAMRSAMNNASGRCLVVGKLVPDTVLEFEQIDETRSLVRFAAKLKLEPVGELGPKAIQAFGHLRRMAEVGVGTRQAIRIDSGSLALQFQGIRLAAYEPDLSKTTMPVVIGEKVASVGPDRVVSEAPMQVRLVRVMEMSRISADGLTMTYDGAGPSTMARSNVSRSRGKWYAEATLKTRAGASAPDTYTTVGVARLPPNELDFITGVPRAEAFNMFANTLPLKDGDVFGIAFDGDESKAYFHVNGRWITGAPGAYRSGKPIAKSTAYVLYAAATGASSSGMGRDAWTLNFGGKKFGYPIPQGYVSWDARLSGPGVKLVAPPSAPGIKPGAVQLPGIEGGINRCRTAAGRIVFQERPCAATGMEQLGAVEASPKSGGRSDRSDAMPRLSSPTPPSPDTSPTPVKRETSSGRY